MLIKDQHIGIFQHYQINIKMSLLSHKDALVFSVSMDQHSQPANGNLLASGELLLLPLLKIMRLYLRLILVWDDSSIGRGPTVKDLD